MVAKKSLVHAQAQLSARLVDIYTSGDQNAGLAVLLGASSLDDMLGRMDASDRVSEQDSLVVKQVARFRREVQHRQRFLQHAHAEQVQVVAERNAARASVEQQLGERKQLLGSIQGEIAHLKAAEAARQAELQRQAQFAAQAASQRQASLAPTVGIGSGGSVSPNAGRTAGHARRCRRDRDAVPRHAVRLGRRLAVRVRLLRLRDVRLRTDGRLAPAQLVRAVRLRQPGLA